MASIITEAYALLGVPNNAPPDKIRSAYLDLVKQHRPDQEPEKFRAVHDAYLLLNDPLRQALALLEPVNDAINLQEVIDKAAAKKPRLPKLVLLGLGNQRPAVGANKPEQG